jgi:hypothetical protein
MCLPSRCLSMHVYSDFTIPAFGRHVTIQRNVMWLRICELESLAHTFKEIILLECLTVDARLSPISHPGSSVYWLLSGNKFTKLVSYAHKMSCQGKTFRIVIHYQLLKSDLSNKHEWPFMRYNHSNFNKFKQIERGNANIHILFVFCERNDCSYAVVAISPNNVIICHMTTYL